MRDTLGHSSLGPILGNLDDFERRQAAILYAFEVGHSDLSHRFEWWKVVIQGSHD